MQGSNYRGQWWVLRGRCILLGWYFKEQVLSSKTQEVVEHTWQISPLLSDELTMAQPGLWCFPLAPGVLNHLLENANAPAEGSTSVLWMGYGRRFQACPLWKGGDAESWHARWIRPRCLTWLRPLSLCPGLREDVLDLAAWLRWGQGCLVQGACWDVSRWKTHAKP